MAEKLLVSVDLAVLKLGISAQVATATEDALIEALLSAQRRIAVELDCVLQAGTSEDVFKLDTDMFSGIQPDGYFRLQLKSGLLSADPVVYAGEDTTGDVLTKGTHYRVNRDKGLIYFKAGDVYDDTFVTVTSEFGYSSSSAVPEWLRDAIIAYTPAMFSANASDSSEDAKQDYKVMVDHAIALLSPYRRNVGLCLRPVFA